MVNDEYMRALAYLVALSSEETEHQTRDADRLYEQLARRLDRAEKKILLRMRELEQAILAQACLNSFDCGFSMAQGCFHETPCQPQFDFIAEQEKHMREFFRKNQAYD